MARFYVEHNGEWNIFSTIVDDFLLDEFVCIDALKAHLLYERYKELTEDIDSLMTDRPRVNVMSYTEATERMRKTEPQTVDWKDEMWAEAIVTEPTCSKMEQVDKPQTDCNGCKFVGTYDTEFPCANCSRKTKDYYAKDEPQTCSFSDCDNFKNPDYERCIECKRKQIKLKTEQTERSSE